MKILDAKIKNLNEELKACEEEIRKLTGSQNWILDEEKQNKNFQLLDQKKNIEKKLLFLQDKEQLEERFRNANITRRVWWNESEFVNPIKTQIENRIFNDDGTNIFLYGEPGVGKTWTVSEVLRDCVYDGKKVKIYHIYELETEVKKSWSFEHKQDDPLEEARNCEVLVLDDLGLERATDAMLKILFEIANKREDLMLPTIYISNFDKKKIFARFNELTNATEIVRAITSRMFGNCEVIEFSGTDKRKEQIPF